MVKGRHCVLCPVKYRPRVVREKKLILQNIFFSQFKETKTDQTRV